MNYAHAHADALEHEHEHEQEHGIDLQMQSNRIESMLLGPGPDLSTLSDSNVRCGSFVLSDSSDAELN